MSPIERIGVRVPKACEWIEMVEQIARIQAVIDASQEVFASGVTIEVALPLRMRRP